MEIDYSFVIIAVVVGVTFAIDRIIDRRHRDIATQWKCARCGAALDTVRPHKSIAVAGGWMQTYAHVCDRCYRRDRLIRWIGWCVLALAAIVAVVLEFTRVR